MYSKCNTCLLSVEIKEDDNRQTGLRQYTVIVELPGSSRDDIKVWQEKGLLTVTGEKKAPSGNRLLSERVYGKLSRTFRLPDDANADKIEANYSNGIVTIEIPKLEEAKSKNIEVK